MGCSTGSCGAGGGCGSGGGCSTGGCGGGGCAPPSNGGIPIVGIQFPSTARTTHFHSAEFQLELGEDCIVEGDRGPVYGRVSRPTILSTYYARNDYPLRKVLRRATLQDREQFDQASEREKDAYVFCRKRIEDRQLPMKLVNVQSTLREGKTVFFFTADGRVDFRALVRDLASKFRVRVEMRQIGVRDAARMLGGYGDCGRPLCCSTFLKHFEPITIQMAKAQDLSLNPARISGMCGRLKCCLRYEYVPSAGKRGKRKGRRQAGADSQGGS